MSRHSHSPSSAHGLCVRVAIIGAGPVGLSTALHLRRLTPGADVTVFDAQVEPAAALKDPRILALSEGSRELLAAAGAWPETAATAIERIHVSQAVDGIAALPRVWLDARDGALPALGYTVSYGELLAALQDAAHRAGIQVHYGRAVRAHAVDNAAFIEEVAPASGNVSSSQPPSGQASAKEPRQVFDIVVLAEGGAFHTQTPRTLRHDYDQIALVGRVRCDRLPRGLAVERFTPGGPVALLPHGSEHALVWCAPPQEAANIREMNRADRMESLQRLLPAVCGRIVELDIVGSYPLGINAQARVRQGRIVQLGNAAQTVHPVAGQGLNLGLRDAATLARMLAARATDDASLSGRDLDRMLRRYEVARFPDRAALLALTDLLARGFTWQMTGTATLRALGLTSLAMVSPMRRWLQRRMVFGWRS